MTVDFWDFFWLLVWSFFFIAYLIVLFQIIADLFRDRELSGWWKAVWIIFLIFLPVLTSLAYLIARGRGMAERQAAAVVQAKHDTDAYPPGHDDVAGRADLARQGAPRLGCHHPEEFAQLKAKALA